MSKDDKSTGSSLSVQTPNAPDYATNLLEALTGGVRNLGNTDPNARIPGMSQGQNAAAALLGQQTNRYLQAPQSVATGGGAYSPTSGGASPLVTGAPANNNGGSSGGGGLFDQLGVNAAESNIFDWDAIAAGRGQNDPNFNNAYSGLTAQQQNDILRVIGDGDGHLSAGDFARFHEQNRQQPLSAEQQTARNAQLNEWSGNSSQKTSDPRTGASSSTPSASIMDMGNGMFGSSPFQNQMVQAGPSAATPAAAANAINNPVQNFTDAANITGNVAGSGPNYAPTSLMDSSALFQMLQDPSNVPEIGSVGVSAGQIAPLIDQFISPYTGQVVDAALSEFDNNAGQVRAQQAAQAAGNGAFGGSRYAIQEAATEGDLSRSRASTDAGLRDQAFNTALGGATNQANMNQQASVAAAQLAQQRNLAEAQMQQDNFNNLINLAFNQNSLNQGALNQGAQFNAGQADVNANRQLSAAGQLAGIGSAQSQDERALATAQASLGDTQRGIAGEQANADMTQLAQMIALAGQLGIDMSQVTGITNNGSSSQTSTPGLVSTLGALGGFFS